MTRRQDAAELVKNGTSPADAAAQMSVSGATIRGYLLEQIAEGALLRSDILRSIDAETKRAYEAYIEAHATTDDRPLVYGSRAAGFDSDQFRLYLDCRDSLRGELYTFIANLELFLHDRIRRALIKEYGVDETDWWRSGVPEQIRISCVTSRETDPYPPGEPYAYTTFIHLSKIIEKNWSVFTQILPRECASDKKGLAETFSRLNAIRNAVMHPVKRFPFSDDDFLFVKSVAASLGNASGWRIAADVQ